MTTTNADFDKKNENYNNTSNTAGGINTPIDHEDSGPLDMISEAVAEIVENIQDTFTVHGKEEDQEK